jgi:hypothetical protein
MQSPDDLPPFADQFRPRWPGDVGGYTADQMHAYRAEGVAKYASLMLAIEWLLDDGHMNQEHLARIRAEWESI